MKKLLLDWVIWTSLAAAGCFIGITFLAIF